jgi:hypothetical protein
MEYTKKVINKFFLQLKKKQSVRKLETINGFFISLTQLHLIANFCGDYKNAWIEVLSFLMEKHWYSKFDEFCVINGFKDDVDTFLQERQLGTMQNALDVYFGNNNYQKWQSFINLTVLFGMKNFTEIYSEWEKYVLNKFKYSIKV